MNERKQTPLPERTDRRRMQNRDKMMIKTRRESKRSRRRMMPPLLLMLLGWRKIGTEERESHDAMMPPGKARKGMTIESGQEVRRRRRNEARTNPERTTGVYLELRHLTTQISMCHLTGNSARTDGNPGRKTTRGKEIRRQPSRVPANRTGKNRPSRLSETMQQKLDLRRTKR